MDFDLMTLVGFSVQISRSDGRVHAAYVKSVDLQKNSVMAEWQENSGVSRGKEIDINELWALNQELLDKMRARFTEEPPERKPDRRLRSSRIPAPPMFSRRTEVARPAAVSRAPAPLPEPAPVAQPEHDFAVPRETRRSQRRPKAGKSSAVAAIMPQISEDQNNDPGHPSVPVPATAYRKTATPVVPLEPHKANNKRVSYVIKPPIDPNNKRGKFGDAKPRKHFSQMIEEFRETQVMVPLSPSEPAEAHRICVCVRKRPLNKKEVDRSEIDVVSIPGGGALLVHEPKTKVDLTRYLDNQTFHFDYSFDESSTNELVYRYTAKPLVQTIFEGGMATCFAYGQTGSGKTHTMGGEFHKKSQNSARGIYAFAAQDVFTLLDQRRYSAMNLTPYVSFFEIYNGKVYDLLNKKALLRVLEDERQQVQVVGLQEVDVSGPEDVIRLIQAGSGCRTSGQTSANACSSRSHAILQVILRCRNKLHGKFSLVDLAGNERGTDVNSNDKATLVETAEINRSLLALKECIRSLGQNSEHIPFRMSKLTQVLRDSFIGEKSKTCMIAMVSPGMASCDYTLNTLRYADRVKELKGPTKAGESDFPKSEEDDDEEEEEEEEEEQEVMESRSSEEEDTLMPIPMPSIYEAITQIADIGERLQKRAVELLGPMGRRWNDVEEGTSELVEYASTLLDMCRSLESNVAEELTGLMGATMGRR